MKKLKILSFSAFFVLATSLTAAETDQFYAAQAVIRDSSTEMNAFFHEKIQLALDIVNLKKNPISCRLAAKEVLKQVVGEFSLSEYVKNKSFSKISVYTQKSPLIERFPPESVSEKDYRSNSIYRHRPFPVNIVGVARTLNLNGIYIGTDKLGHFSIVGKTYYKNFLKGLEDGLGLDEAQSSAILKGFKQEVALLGYAVGGTFSYGDLEANYQGLQFGRNMCEGDIPYLIQSKKLWIQNPSRLFDIRKYINPKYDEAYNVSFWSPRMWKKMKGEIISSYCKNKDDPDYKIREHTYNQIVTSSVNDSLLVKFLKEHPKFNRDNQLLSKNIKCDSL